MDPQSTFMQNDRYKNHVRVEWFSTPTWPFSQGAQGLCQTTVSWQHLRLDIRAFYMKKCFLFCRQMHLLSNTWVQGHYIQCLWTQAFASTPTSKHNILFSSTYTHSITHIVDSHIHIKSERVVLTAERCQLLGFISFWQAGGTASTTSESNLTHNYIIVLRRAHNKNQLLSRTIKIYSRSVI